MSKNLWEVVKGPGQPRKFESPQDMWDRAVKYFEWCGERVIIEEKIGFYQGEATSGYVKHQRPMTQAGLCSFLGIGVSTWHDYKTKYPDYSEVTEMIEGIMFEQKFTGAATGQFNSNIIARDLGLTDKSEVKMDNASVTPWDEIGDEDEDE